MPHDEKLAQSVKLMLAMAIYCTYALSQYVAFDLLWNNIIEPKLEKTKMKIIYEYGVRTTIVIITCEYLHPRSTYLSKVIPSLERRIVRYCSMVRNFISIPGNVTSIVC